MSSLRTVPSDLVNAVQQGYVDLLEAWQAHLGAEGRTLLLESVLWDSARQAVLSDVFQTPSRIDVSVIAEDDTSSIVSIDTEDVVEFEPFAVEIVPGLRVDVHPFTWDGLRVHLPNGEFTWSPLIDWFQRWVGALDEGDPTRWKGVVHLLSDPIPSPHSIDLEIDLGSAPVGAFDELMKALSEIGAPYMRID